MEKKPNPSELARLLYYASTKPRKLPKVAEFLEMRTTRAVRKSRSGHAQVGIDIFEALIEKCDRDLNLFAIYVLMAINSIFQSKDFSLIEHSTTAFQTLCTRYNGANINNDSRYLSEYLRCLRGWAAIASRKDPADTHRMHHERFIGMKALKSICSSEALHVIDPRGQLDILMSVILSALYSEDSDYLLTMQHKASEQLKKAKPLSTDRLDRKMSTSTALTSDTDMVPDDEELQTSITAMQCLQHIFEVSDPLQIRDATAAMIRCVANVDTLVAEHWVSTLFEQVSRWTPLQIRFMILITAVNILEQMHPEQVGIKIKISLIISNLLSSRVNFMGLSVIDVLQSLLSELNNQVYGGKVLEKTSTGRNTLHEQLMACISRLATHVYYSDQVSDIVSEILAGIRKKDEHESTDFDIDEYEIPTDDSVRELLSSAKMKVDGLRAVKEVIVLANDTSGEKAPRTRVELSVWEHTAFLLTHENEAVRSGYIDAVTTFLRFEGEETDDEARMGKQTNATAGFLAELHLAIYDLVIASHSEDDLQSVYFLLVVLVDKLGLNEILRGLPVVFKIQEEAIIRKIPRTKQITISSIIGGYLFAIARRLELGAMEAKVLKDIERRRGVCLWDHQITIPPKSLSNGTLDEKVTSGDVGDVPVFNRRNIVDDLASEMPMFPPRLKEQLLLEWDREAAAVEREEGSHITKEPLSRPSSLHHSHSARALHSDSRNAMLSADVLDKAPARQVYKQPLTNGAADGDATPASRSSSAYSEMRVEELKRVLSHNRGRKRSVDVAPVSRTDSVRSRRSSLRHASIENTKMEMPRSGSIKAFENTPPPPVPPLPESHRRDTVAQALDVDSLLKHMDVFASQDPGQKPQPPYKY